MRKTLGSLSKNVAIYGAGDVAISVVSLLLLPIYVRKLTQDDYGALAVLGSIEALAKISFRWGLDGAFMRYYLDRTQSATLDRLASTLFLFLAGASGLMVAVAYAASPLIARLFFRGSLEYLLPLRLVLVNTFLLTFTFLPFHAMRMRGQAVAFSAFAFGRSSATLALRIVLVIWAGWGVTGLAAADLIVTVAVLPLLWPWCRPMLRLVFSRDELRTCLHFGLPRLPHGLAQQALDAGNKLLLNAFVAPSTLGVYQIGTSLGQSLKFFLSAFETGWAPFYYETARRPDAKVTFSKITTYGIAILVLLVAGVTAVARDVVLLLTNRSYQGASVIVPIIALGVAFQGVYLLTSIGLNLTSQTKYYPVSTFAAAAAGLGSGAILMPLFGAVGAAVSFLISYVTLAAVAGFYSQRTYPMDYEKGRIARLVGAAVIAAGVALALPHLPPLGSFLLRGSTTVAVFVALLWAGGFLRATERAFLATLWRRPAGLARARR